MKTFLGSRYQGWFDEDRVWLRRLSLADRLLLKRDQKLMLRQFLPIRPIWRLGRYPEMKTILLIFLLFAAPAIAADVAPSPAQTAQAAALRAILAIEHARAEVRLAVDAQEAATQGARASAVAPVPAMAAPTVTAPPPPVPDAPASAVPAPTVDAAPVVVQGPIETKLSIPAQIQTDLISLASVLITGMVGIGLAWMRSHLAFMQNIGMNQQVTASAEGFGALMVQQLKQQGIPATLDIHSPHVAEITQKVLDNYSGYVAALGITPDKVATLILKGAAKVLPPTDPAPTKPVIITQAPGTVTQAPQPIPATVPQDPYGGARDGRAAPHATAPTWPS
jgi:hypothetical protein